MFGLAGGALAFVLIAGLILYFVPTIIAEARHHQNQNAIFALNIFLAWTVLGWIACLVWACTAVEHRPRPAGIAGTLFGQKMVCVHCGQALPDWATVCINCGKAPGFQAQPRPAENLREPGPAAGAALARFCAACGAARPENAGFCPQCGAKLA